MAAEKGNDRGEIVCEFFGIEITTKNPRVAKILTSDVSEILNTDIKVIKGKWSDEIENEAGEAEVGSEVASGTEADKS